jgi:hypothetical protein
MKQKDALKLVTELMKFSTKAEVISLLQNRPESDPIFFDILWLAKVRSSRYRRFVPYCVALTSILIAALQYLLG